MTIRDIGIGIDDLLRQEVRSTSTRFVGGRAFVLFLVCGGFYGAVMATYLLSSERSLLVLYGAMKVPILFGLTMTLAVPGLYVLSALSGVGGDFPRVFSLLIDYQLRVSVLLAALAPITILVNLTAPETAYAAVQLWNTLTFAVAALLAQWKFTEAAKPLIAEDARHRLLLRLWSILYAFIGIQMAWTLRPFIGLPGSRVSFFREGGFENAYIKIYEIFAKLLANVFT